MRIHRYVALLLILLASSLSACVPSQADLSTPTSALISSSPTNVAPSSVPATSAPQPTSTSFSTASAQPTVPALPTATSPIVVPTPTLPTATNTPTAILGNLRVHYIDVGQGDSILIVSPDGKTMLIDGGEQGSGALVYLQSLGIDHLDLMVATHPHSDHIGGLVEILRAMPVDEVVTNGQPHTTSIYERFLDAIDTAKAVYIEAQRGDQIALGNLVFEVLSPARLSGADLNDNSLVLRLEYGATSFLFTGDVQAEGEGGLLASGLPLQATILKVAHHGSASSSTPAFLAAVHLKVAVYSAGLGNDYGHPRPETLAHLAGVGAEIYGTDVNGTVIVTTDGSGYSVQTAREGQAQAPPQVMDNPTAPAASSELTLAVVSLTSPIAHGGTASLTIQTTPGAACSITVFYKSGPSQAAGLGPETADAGGKCAWSWKVGSRTSPGIWQIAVQVSLNAQTQSQDIPFEVR
ncbi:MAG: MBL fold metallo-hydrolase [Anaerolineaceae bacterium]|nr:MBL fold metallo-hydrolase [Anaerolineaceae bacterium]